MAGESTSLPIYDYIRINTITYKNRTLSQIRPILFVWLKPLGKTSPHKLV